eukprot:3683107-Alexandrium_andersonii.AAC.1
MASQVEKQIKEKREAAKQEKSVRKLFNASVQWVDTCKLKVEAAETVLAKAQKAVDEAQLRLQEAQDKSEAAEQLKSKYYEQLKLEQEGHAAAEETGKTSGMLQ